MYLHGRRAGGSQQVNNTLEYSTETFGRDGILGLQLAKFGDYIGDGFCIDSHNVAVWFFAEQSAPRCTAIS
ncbi:MAG: hypothetical protein NC311_16515 [Muribaculaceae bacterium]|nr:hypothetical protein [Muribaculaceae bacterium]